MSSRCSWKREPGKCRKSLFVPRLKELALLMEERFICSQTHRDRLAHERERLVAYNCLSSSMVLFLEPKVSLRFSCHSLYQLHFIASFWTISLLFIHSLLNDVIFGVCTDVKTLTLWAFAQKKGYHGDQMFTTNDVIF